MIARIALIARFRRSATGLGVAVVLALAAFAAACNPNPIKDVPLNLLVERIDSTCLPGNKMHIKVQLRSSTSAPDQYEVVFEPEGAPRQVVSGTIKDQNKTKPETAVLDPLPGLVTVSVFRIQPGADPPALPSPASAGGGRYNATYTTGTAERIQPNPCIPKTGLGPASQSASTGK